MNWPNCLNARDLGGLERDGGVTRSGVMVRSDNLGHLTDAGRDAMLAFGITTVIDLRSPSELALDGQKSALNGVRHVHTPLVDDANMRKLGDATGMYERYLMMLDNRPHAFRDIFNALAGAEGGTVFHCFAGKDRTGLIAAMLLELAGATNDAIAADYSETDIQLADQYQRWITESEPESRDAMRDELQCPPDRILGVLDYLEEKWGGVASYLKAAGMPASSIDRISAKLT